MVVWLAPDIPGIVPPSRWLLGASRVGLLFRAFPPDGRSQKLPSTTRITNPNDNPIARTLKLPCRPMPHLRVRDASEFATLFFPKRGRTLRSVRFGLQVKSILRRKSFMVSNSSGSTNHGKRKRWRVNRVPTGRRASLRKLRKALLSSAPRTKASRTMTEG
jgi:hypothetical protein